MVATKSFTTGKEPATQTTARHPARHQHPARHRQPPHHRHKITIYRRESPIYFTVTRFLLTELYISSCFVSLRQFSSATQSVLVYSGKCHRSHFLIKV